MRQKTHSELNRLIGCAAISGLLLLNVQCRQPQNTNITIYSSSRDGDRLTKKADEAFIPDKESSLPIIKINAGKRFQKMDGFGATFNEAGLITLNTLAPEKKDSVLRRLFDPASGAGYTLMKSPIADNSWYSDVTYKEMAGLIKDFVAPRLQANGLTTKIQLGETVSRSEALGKFPAVLEDSTIRKHISGLAVHGYDWDNFSALKELYNKFPGIPIRMTEVCYTSQGISPANGPKKSPVYEFSDGEFWGNTIMNDTKNWVSGWIYWNMILDQDGGPWLVSSIHGDPDPNQQHPVVIIDRNSKEVTYTGLYYYLAHFSKFIRPGAYRIDCTTSDSTKMPKLNFVGFQNPDGSIILNIINSGDVTDCKISWAYQMTIQKLKAHSITTLKWQPAYAMPAVRV